MAKKKTKEGIPLTIEWNIPDDIITRFATNFVVQTIENEFKISFFELKHSIVLTDEDRAKLREKGTIRADCVGSFIVTADRIPQLINILNQQLHTYNEKQGKKES